MKQSSQKKKKSKTARKHGNTPVYMRHEVSASMFRENPQYRHIFHKCPICSRYSLKPVGLNKIDKVTEVLETNERRCTICNFITVKHLEVFTEPKVAEELIHLGKEIYRVGGEIAKIEPDPDLIVKPEDIRYIADLTEIFEEQSKQLDKMIERGNKKK